MLLVQSTSPCAEGDESAELAAATESQVQLSDEQDNIMHQTAKPSRAGQTSTRRQTQQPLVREEAFHKYSLPVDYTTEDVKREEIRRENIKVSGGTINQRPPVSSSGRFESKRYQFSERTAGLVFTGMSCSLALNTCESALL